VTLVTRAWSDSKISVRQTTEEALECLFHPDFHDQRSKVQREMLQYMRNWINSLGHKQHEILDRLTKDSVRNHRNVRPGTKENAAQGTAAYNYGVQAQHNVQGYFNQIPGVAQAQSAMGYMQNLGQPQGPRRDMPDPGSRPPQGGFSPPSGPPPSMPDPGAGGFSFPGGPTSQPAFPSPPGPPPGHAPSFPSFPNPGQGYGSPPPQFPGGGSPFAPPSGPPPSWAGQPPPPGGSPYAPPPVGYPPPNSGPQGGYSPNYGNPYPGGERRW